MSFFILLSETVCQAVVPPAPFTWGGDRGISPGDLYNSSAVTAMHYFSISVLSGNATDFGNMTVARATGAGADDRVAGGCKARETGDIFLMIAGRGRELSI